MQNGYVRSRNTEALLKYSNAAYKVEGLHLRVWPRGGLHTLVSLNVTDLHVSCGPPSPGPRPSPDLGPWLKPRLQPPPIGLGQRVRHENN